MKRIFMLMVLVPLAVAIGATARKGGLKDSDLVVTQEQDLAAFSWVGTEANTRAAADGTNAAAIANEIVSRQAGDAALLASNAAARAAAAVAATNLQGAIDAGTVAWLSSNTATRAYAEALVDAEMIARTNATAGLWAGIAAYSNYVAGAGYLTSVTNHTQGASTITDAPWLTDASTLSVADARRVVQSDTNAWITVENGTGVEYVVTGHIRPTNLLSVVVSSTSTEPNYNGPPVGTILTKGTIYAEYTDYTNGDWIARVTGFNDEWYFFKIGSLFSWVSTENGLPAHFVPQGAAVGSFDITWALLATNRYTIATDDSVTNKIADHDHTSLAAGAHGGLPTAEQIGAVSTNDTRYLAAITNFTDTIHGARGGLNLHSLADGSGAGFLSALQYAQIGNMASRSNAWDAMTPLSGDVTRTGTLGGSNAVAGTDYPTLAQVGSLLGGVSVLYASTNQTLVTDYYDARTFLPTHANGTISIGSVTTGQYMAKWASNTNLITMIRGPSIATITARMRITTTTGGRSLTCKPEIYLLHADGIEPELMEVSQIKTMTGTMADYSCEINVPSNVTVIATDRLVVKWKAVTAANSPTWEFECGKDLVIAARFPVANATAVLADAPNDGNLYGRKNMLWQSIPGPGCTDLGAVTDVTITGATTSWRAQPAGVYTVNVAQAASRYVYALEVVSTNACTLAAGLNLQGSWTITGTNVLVITPCTGTLWRVYGRGI